MITAFNDSPGSEHLSTHYQQPWTGALRGYSFAVKVNTGEVARYSSDLFSPFLSEGQTNLINVFWYQGSPAYLFNYGSNLSGTAYFNFLQKDASPVHFYAHAAPSTVPAGTIYETGQVGTAGAVLVPTAGPLGAAVSVSIFRNPAWQLSSCRIVARTLDNLAIPAFDITATTVTTAPGAANQIVLMNNNGTTTVSEMPRATFVVTNFHPDFLEQAAERLRGGDTTPITLRAQIQTVVSPLASPFNPNFSGVATTPFWIWPSVVTLLSDHFPLLYRTPVTRSAYYGV